MRVLQTINGCITYFSQKREISDTKFDKIIQLLKTTIIGAVMMTAICTQGIHGLFFSTVIAAGVGLGWLIKKMEI